MRRYRGNILLIELLITLLFFSLSQVVIVQVFAAAQKNVQDNRVLHEALVVVQDASEQISTYHQPEKTLSELGFASDANGYVWEGHRGCLVKAAVERQHQSGGVLCTTIFTAELDDQVLFTLPSVVYEGAVK